VLPLGSGSMFPKTIADEPMNVTYSKQKQNKNASNP
jgi:hypothetical protein